MSAPSGPRKSAPRKLATVPEDNDLFRYELEDGTEIVLPKFNSVKPGVIRKIRKLSDVDQFFTVLEELADEETLAVVDNLTQEVFQDVQLAWFKHAGITLGES